MFRTLHIMILFLLVLAHNLLGCLSQEFTSPCPNVFQYERQTEKDRWYGVISAKSTEELAGVWITIKLDSKAELIGNWFGDTYSTDNQEFLISNPNYVLEAGPPVSIRFFVKYNLSRDVPRLELIRLNGKIVCSNEENSVKPTTPKLHISKPKITKQPSVGLSYEPTDGSHIDDDVTTIHKTTSSTSNFNRPQISSSEDTSSNSYRPATHSNSHNSFNDDDYNKPYRGSGSTTNQPTNPSKYRPVVDVYDSEKAQGYGSQITNTVSANQNGYRPSSEVVQDNYNYKPSLGSGSAYEGNSNSRPFGSTTSDYSSTSRHDVGNKLNENAHSDTNYTPIYNEDVDDLQSNRHRNTERTTRKPTNNYKNDEYNEYGNKNSHSSSSQTYNNQKKDSDEDFFVGDFNINRPSSSSRPAASEALSSSKNIECGTVAYRPRPLITNGQDTMPGEWPWHVAIYHTKGIQLVYICGGSLISDRHILTAAHCVSKARSNKVVEADSILVYLGKYNLKTFGPETQDRDISDIYIHPEYNYTMFYNDIAILKLSRPVEFTDYVRPCCLWSENTNLDNIVEKQGTVIGWGFDDKKRISEKLMQAKMPVVSTIKCIYSNRDFFAKFTFDKNYCAGFLNGTSVCNGDSGGSMVFPKRGTSGQDTVWQIRGIVSVGVALQSEGVCDTSQYVIFTDVAKHLTWIKQTLRN